MVRARADDKPDTEPGKVGPVGTFVGEGRPERTSVGRTSCETGAGVSPRAGSSKPVALE